MITVIPTKNSKNVGIKSPVTGTGSGVIEGLALSVAEGVADLAGIDVGVILGVAEGVGVPAFAVGFGVAVGVGVGVLPDCDAVNAGTSPAWTTKSLVSVLMIPVASVQEIVIEWDPSESGVGGL